MDNTSFPKINYDHVLGGEFAAFVRISEVEGMASALTKLLSPSAAARLFFFYSFSFFFSFFFFFFSFIHFPFSFFKIIFPSFSSFSFLQS